MAKMTVKRVGVLSIAKIQALIAAVFGLIIGVFYGMILTAMSAMMSSRDSGLIGGMGIISIFIFPVIYGVLGFIGGAIAALIYNFAAGFMGGVELELESAEKTYGAPPQSYSNPYGAPYGGGGSSQ